MVYFTPLPSPAGYPRGHYIDIVDGSSTVVQRALRRGGLAGYEPPTVAAFLALAEMAPDGFTFFDIGANVGLYSSLCAALFDPAHVVAFEPTPDTARVARKISRVNQLGTRIEELALGRSPGTASLYLSAKSDASNSLVEGFKESTGTIDVTVTTVDDFVAEHRMAPHLVKIDAETFEPEILAGAVGTIAKHRPYLIVEVLHRKGHDHGVEMMQAMAELDYFYYPISTYSEWRAHEVITGDPEGDERDWLLAPSPLPGDFLERFERWESAIAECTPDRNRSTRPVRRSRVAELADVARGQLRRVRSRVARLVR